MELLGTQASMQGELGSGIFSRVCMGRVKDKGKSKVCLWWLARWHRARRASFKTMRGVNGGVRVLTCFVEPGASASRNSARKGQAARICRTHIAVRWGDCSVERFKTLSGNVYVTLASVCQCCKNFEWRRMPQNRESSQVDLRHLLL